jgi:hypothetical protein
MQQCHNWKFLSFWVNTTIELKSIKTTNNNNNNNHKQNTIKVNTLKAIPNYHNKALVVSIFPFVKEEDQQMRP